jgi:hypothetical protein
MNKRMDGISRARGRRVDRSFSGSLVRWHGWSEQCLRNRLHGSKRGLSEGPNTSRRNTADLVGACPGGKFVVCRGQGRV